jgi:SsrA-binding protein
MRIILENKKALFDYSILEKFEAGIVLLGLEVKSIKTGRMNLRGSFVVISQSPTEVSLIGANIPPYQPNNTPDNYNPKRSRKLLLKKAEIKHLIGKSREKGLTMVPIKVYTIKGKIKIEFAIVRGKKKFDKREQIKKRESKKDIERMMKRG